ncbi:MAG: tetratricopeptide repeat protein [Gemmatimonadota bacterium]|nr:tetratricopeptide repeat protein [Gemmatimonadota bacterium]
MKSILTLAIALSLTLLGASPLNAQTGHDLFQQALVKERADGDLRGAIQIYERIAEEFTTDRALTAKALVQMGQCYEKLGSTEAERAYRRVVREFADQDDLVVRARTRLAALDRAARAAEAVSIATRLVSRETGGDWLSITPDGKHAVYTDYGSGDLALRDVATGEIRFLTDDATWDEPWQYPWSATVSPDGRWVVYGWWVQDQPSDIRVVSNDGLDSRVLYAEEAFSVWPLDWSSDGGSVLASRSGGPASDGVELFQLVLVSVRDSAARLLKDFGQRPFGGTRVFSPDDRYVVYDVPVEADSGMRDIWVLAVDGSGDLPVVQHPANDRLLGWVPGTDDVVFLSDRDGTWDAWAVTVASSGADAVPRLLQRNIGEVQPINFTQDGSLFYQAYTRWFSTSVAPFDAARGTVDEGSAVAIRGSNMNAAWSPDGGHLALVSEEHGAGGPGFEYRRPLRVRDMATGKEHELGRLKQVRRPHWSPDGMSILINARDEERDEEGYNGGLYVVDVRSGNVSHVMDVPEGTAWWYGFEAKWSVDGRAIIYSAYNEDAKDGRLVWRELASGSERELYRDSRLTARILDLHPDGRRLLFGLRETPEGSPATIQGAGRLMVLDLEKQGVRELTAIQDSGRVNSVQWTPDGQHALYGTGLINKGTQVWRISVDGGEPEKLWTFAEDRFGGQFDVSPDGRKVALRVYSQEYEIWVMEGLKEVLSRQ